MPKTSEEHMAVTDYWIVACGGCHQRIGITAEENPSSSRIYCSEMCAGDFPTADIAEKADAWDFLVAKGRSKVSVARMYGAPHSQVYRAIDRLQRPITPKFAWLLTDEQE